MFLSRATFVRCFLSAFLLGNYAVCAQAQERKLISGTTVSLAPESGAGSNGAARRPAREPLRHAQPHHDMLDTATTPGGAQKFPRAASARISFSSVRSETALRSRGAFGLEFLHPLHLIRLQPAELAPPAVIGEGRHSDWSRRFPHNACDCGADRKCGMIDTICRTRRFRTHGPAISCDGGSGRE